MCIAWQEDSHWFVVALWTSATTSRASRKSVFNFFNVYVALIRWVSGRSPGNSARHKSQTRRCTSVLCSCHQVAAHTAHTNLTHLSEENNRHCNFQPLPLQLYPKNHAKDSHYCFGERQLDELINRYHRLSELHVQRQLYLPQSKLHGELVRLQEHILDSQDEITEYECEMKVLRKMVKRNEKIMTRLRNGDWRDIKETTKSDSSQSLLSTNNDPVEPFLPSPAAA